MSDNESGEWLTVKTNRKPQIIRHINQLVLKNTVTCEYGKDCRRKNYCPDSHTGEIVSVHNNILNILKRLHKGHKIIIERRVTFTDDNDEYQEKLVQYDLTKELLYKSLIDNRITCKYKENCKKLNNVEDKCTYVHTCKCKEKKCRLIHFTRY